MKRTPLARKPSTLKRKAVSPASPAQREKIRHAFCAVTGDSEHLTPAHVIDRSLGGCDDPLCVVPLRVDVHRAYDLHELDLLPFLEPRFRAELAHAVMHLGLLGTLKRVTGEDWRPE